MKKTLAFLLGITMLFPLVSCDSDTETSSKNSEETNVSSVDSDSLSTSDSESSESEKTEEGYKYQEYASMTPEEIVASMTLEQKAYQMVQPAVYNITEEDMKKNNYGSILSQMGCVDTATWRDIVDTFQQAAIESETGIPYIYGQDDVHGVNYCLNAVYFPHNIGQGAANNEELAYQVGLITADEAKLCHMMWNFSPCVAQSVDPRWGRTYESYGSDLETITKLSTAYTKGLIDGGLIACAKHYLGDGNVVYGTGEQGAIKMLIDRGDAQLTDEEIDELLKVYQAQIDAGVQTIMVSHSALNGVKMHENKEYIMKLKDEMGFEGFIVSDWDSVGNISGETYTEQVIKSVNAGIDMLMETERFEEAKQIIIDAVGGGEISEERINDAVTRIIKVKKDAGIFDDPLCENITTEQTESGSLDYRKVAEKLVEESLVLLKNDENVLPLKEGTKVYITGPAADNGQVQCGGWTMDWNSAPTSDVPGTTTILEAFERYAEDYGIEVITEAEEASNADVVLLCVGEQSYAEWNGDTEDLELCGALGLKENTDAINEVKELDKPTVTCIVAGRQVILDPEDYEDWDSVVMCYLPGSEGKGISDVLCGSADFTGKLPSPWYGSIEQIGTEECFLERGYGLSYGEDFTPKTEPVTVLDTPTETGSDDMVDPMEGTNYTAGLFKDGVYVNEYADIKVNIPGTFSKLSESNLALTKENALSCCSEDKDIARESAKFYDNLFLGSSDYITFVFMNTELGIPDVPNYTGENYLDDFKDFYISLNESDGLESTLEDRTTVILGGNEYVRDVMKVTDGVGTQYLYVYARKLDDNLMCIIEMSGISTDKSPEYYEELFN